MTEMVVDQMGRSVVVLIYPKRIISLVPSQTELLYTLGLDKSVVGITKFCVHPKKWFQNKTRIGGTKNINFDLIHLLQPDLIIGNKEENSRQDIEVLSQRYPVWMSDIFNLDDALQMIENIGSLTKTEIKSKEIINQITNAFAHLKPSNEIKQKVLYLIWKNPFIAAGRNTFINEMLEEAGFENYIQEQDSRYPEVDLNKLNKNKPDLIFLSSEPYPFKESHLRDFHQQIPTSLAILVDGEMFSWYGSRLVKAPQYFNNLQRTIERLKSPN